MGGAVLILSRRKGESILIGKDVEIAVVKIKGDQVQIGVRAPRDVVVDRKEVADRKAVEAEISDLLHVDAVVKLPAGEVRRLRPGIDYDPDAVCPGCGCFRDKCACDLREAAQAFPLDANNGLPEPSTFPAMPAVAAPKGNMSGRARMDVKKVFEKLALASGGTVASGQPYIVGETHA